VPLSLRGAQQCVTLTWAGGHLRSVAVCECGFMPLAGAMANADSHQPVPGHPGVHMQAAAETRVDIGLVAGAMDAPGPAAGIGISVSAWEVFGSLRRWLAFHDRAAASLSYIGPPEGADASGVPPVLEFRHRDSVQRASPCLLGRAGFAVLDAAGPVATAGEPGRRTMLELAVRGYGQAEQETARLGELVTAWDAAGRPGTDRLRIDAYPAGSSPPPAEGSLHRARHTTFVVSLL